MSLFQQSSFGPKAQHDPMLASYEREKLQAELARGILDVVQTGERDLLQVTNRAIRRVRERILVPGRRAGFIAKLATQQCPTLTISPH